jgi:hypothetical protein
MGSWVGRVGGEEKGEPYGEVFEAGVEALEFPAMG